MKLFEYMKAFELLDKQRIQAQQESLQEYSAKIRKNAIPIVTPAPAPTPSPAPKIEASQKKKSSSVKPKSEPTQIPKPEPIELPTKGEPEIDANALESLLADEEAVSLLKEILAKKKQKKEEPQ